MIITDSELMYNDDLSRVSIRLDKYLWFIRLFKTRTLSCKACNSNKVKYLGKTVKASHDVKIGDIYKVSNKEIEVLGIPPYRCSYEKSKFFYKVINEKQLTFNDMQKSNQGDSIKPNKKQRRILTKLLDR